MRILGSFIVLLQSFTWISAAGTYGKEFYIGMFPSRGTVTDVRIDVTAKEFGRLTTEVAFLNIRSQIMVIKGTTTIHINGSLVRSGSFSENRGIRISSDVPVLVTVTSVGTYQETYLALPISALGMNYTVASFFPSAYLLVGSHDNTSVEIMDTVKGKVKTHLNKGTVYQVTSSQDISDMTISGNKKFSLISGSSCAYIADLNVCNILLEQMIPSKFGSKYFIVPSFSPMSRYMLKTFSLKDTLHCYTNRTRHFCKSSKETLQTFQSALVVSSDTTANVVVYAPGERIYFRYSRGRVYATSYRRPFMMVVPGISSYRNEYYFAVPATYSALTNYLCVIIPSKSESGLRLDGHEFGSKLYKETVPSPFSNYTTFKVAISLGYHELKHTDKNVLFGALVFGYAYDRDTDGGYGFAAGFDIAVDECSAEACKNGGTCTDTIDGFICTCAEGFTGTFCEDDLQTSTETTRHCISNPCQNKGTCWRSTNGFVCSCADGFYGSLCENALKPSTEATRHCESQPCQNNGTCFDNAGGFVCSCTEGFYGFVCENATKHCISNPCLNKGTCREGTLGYVCSCVDGFYGSECENAITTSTLGTKRCYSNPCQNGGSCWEVLNGFVCSCAQGFYGSTCENAITTSTLGSKRCYSNPCQNGGSCWEVLNGFVCSCAQGFYGSTCENGMNPGSEEKESTVCSFDVCMNGGLCKETNNNFTCYCLDGFSGRHCEKRTENGKCGLCLNGGICQESNNNFTCYCLDGFFGRHCEKRSVGAPQVASENTSSVVIPTFGAILAVLAVLAVIVYVFRKKKKQAEPPFKVRYHTSENSVGISNELYGNNEPSTRSEETEKEQSSFYESVSIGPQSTS